MKSPTRLTKWWSLQLLYFWSFNEVWVSLNVDNQDWCNMLHGVTTLWRTPTFSLSHVPLLLLCNVLTLHTYFSPLLFIVWTFIEHLQWVRDPNRAGHMEIKRKWQSFPWRSVCIESYHGAWKRAYRCTGVRQRQSLVPTVWPWTHYLASLSSYFLLYKIEIEITT